MIKIYWKIVVVVLAMFSGTQASQAASSSWQDLGGGKARMLAQMDPASGKIDVAIQVKLEPGWSTYWRYPGSSGIPPRFDFSASTGLEFAPVLFPVPSMLGSGEMSYAGYKRSVVFPFTATYTSNPVKRIQLSLLIGLCKDICIPAQASFTIGPEGFFETDPDAKRVIGFSSLKMPDQKNRETLDFSVSLLEPGNAIIRIKAKTGSKAPILYVEGPMDWNLLPVQLHKDTGSHLEFQLMIPKQVTASELEKTSLFFTLSKGLTGIEFRH